MPNRSAALSSDPLFQASGLGSSWSPSHDAVEDVAAGLAGGLAQIVANLARGFTGELQRELRKELLELSTDCHEDYDSTSESWTVVCARAQPVLAPAHPNVMSQTESSSEQLIAIAS